MFYKHPKIGESCFSSSGDIITGIDSRRNALRGWFQHTHHKSKMADGRHLGKIEKSSYCHISATV